MGGVESTAYDDTTIPEMQDEWRELMDDLIYIDDDSIIDEDDQSDDNRSVFFSPACTIKQVPTWLFERQEYERDLVKWHKKKAKSLRKHAKPTPLEFTLQPQRKSWLLNTFQYMTCYGCGETKNESQSWGHASNAQSQPHPFKPVIDAQKPKPPAKYIACMSHWSTRQ